MSAGVSGVIRLTVGRWPAPKSKVEMAMAGHIVAPEGGVAVSPRNLRHPAAQRVCTHNRNNTSSAIAP